MNTLNTRLSWLWTICMIIAVHVAIGQTTISGTVNSYYEVTSMSGNDLTLSSTSGLSTGDDIILIQMTGVTGGGIGGGTDDGAGNFVRTYITNISGSVITVHTLDGKTFSPSTEEVQVVSLPSYNGPVQLSGDVTGTAWNGSTGGVIAIDACGYSIDLNGNDIDATGIGFYGRSSTGTTSQTSCGGQSSALSGNDERWGVSSNYFGGGFSTPGGPSGGTGRGGHGGCTGTQGTPSGGGGVGGYGAIGVTGTLSSGGGGGGYGGGGSGANIYNGTVVGSDAPTVGNVFSTSFNLRLFMGAAGGSEEEYAIQPGAGGGLVILICDSLVGSAGSEVISNGTTAGIESVLWYTSTYLIGAGGGGAGYIVITAPDFMSTNVSVEAIGGGANAQDNSGNTREEFGGPGGGGFLISAYDIPSGQIDLSSGTRGTGNNAKDGADGKFFYDQFLDDLMCRFDTDNDAIIDILDVDDDNDGIPDYEEGCDVRLGWDDRLDWDNESWSGTSNTYNLTNLDVDVVRSSTGGSISSSLATTMTGGLSPSQDGLYTTANFANKTQTVTYSFDLSDTVNEASFTMFDIDGDFNGSGRHTDEVTVTGYLSGTTVNPTMTEGFYNDVTGTTAEGNDASGNSTAYGNVVVSFASTIDSFTVAFKCATSSSVTNPNSQAFTIHDIYFQQYPSGECTVDADGDGVLDNVDIDADNDGVLDLYESGLDLALIAVIDADSDGVIDNTVAVGSNGLADTIQDATEADSLNFTVADTDGDGIIDSKDLDSDNDGITDLAENGNGTDSNNDGLIDGSADADGDGMLDSGDSDDSSFGSPGSGINDTDGDGLANNIDLDSDNDGILDLVENPDGTGTDANNDGIVDGSSDTDGDGILNSADSDDSNPGSPNSEPTDTDGDGVINANDLDSDNDGILDLHENPDGTGTDSNNDGVVDGSADADNDGVLDSADSDDSNLGSPNNVPTDTDGDGSLYNAIDLDADNDGIPDLHENTDGTGTDSNGDGIVDGSADSDGDGVLNSADSDDSNHGSPNSDPADSDNDGLANEIDIDSDNDGIMDLEENVDGTGTDANSNGVVDGSADADGDGILDSADSDDSNDGSPGSDPTDTDSDGIANPYDIDADDDGIIDNIEAQATTGSPDQAGGTDTDGDGLDNVFETTGLSPEDTDSDGTPDYLDSDSDNDGYPDLLEGWDTDGDYAANTSPANSDTDGDGLDNNFDNIVGPNATTNPSNNGEDANDFPNQTTSDQTTERDWREANDYDGDGIADNVDYDDDNDGILDDDESLTNDPNGDEDGDGMPNWLDTSDGGNGGDGSTTSYTDSNGDGIPDVYDFDEDGIPNHLDLDSDNDGITDLAENPSGTGTDSNGDGIVDGSADADNDGILDSADSNDGAAGSPGSSIEDTDGDGNPDSQDLDSDNDGIPDLLENPDGTGTDSNNDGIVDGSADADGDGILDSADSDDANAGSPNSEPTDTDGDGVHDAVDLDSDNDGITDLAENPDGSGTDSNNDGVVDGSSDTDGDGILNSADSDDANLGSPNSTTTDSDGDGVDDHLDLDSDNDGITDLAENPDGTGTDSNNDGIVDGSSDSDGDGILNSADSNDSSHGSPNSDPTDTDGDGLADPIDLDSDNDGITDLAENPDGTGTDSNNDGVVDGSSDSDGDGILNSADSDDSNLGSPNTTPTDTDGDGLHDAIDLDSDNDGITDLQENPDGTGTDSNNDGVVDGSSDSDSDGILNSADSDDSNAGSPNTTPTDTDGDGLSNAIDLDSDNDGITDLAENPDGTGTDSNNDGIVDGSSDADNDGILNSADSDDSNNGSPNGTPTDTDQDGLYNAIDIDADNDGITDLRENLNGTGTDSNNDGVVDGSADADNDGILDSADSNDSASGSPSSDPNDTDSDGFDDFLDIDADNDGIVDYIEAQATTGSPTAPSGSDTDGDGLDNNFESTGLTPVDTDGDSTPDYIDTDSDNDGESDSVEGWDTDGDGTAETTASGTDSDGDGLDNAFDNVNGANSTTNVTNNGEDAMDFPNEDEGGNERDWREVPCAGGDITLAPNNTTTTASAYCVEGGWTYYYDPADSTELLFAIERTPTGGNTNDVTIEVDITVSSNPTLASGVYSATDVPNEQATFVMGRYFNFNVTSGSLNGAVNVRFYYNTAEATRTQTTAEAWNAANAGNTAFVSGLRWFAVNSGTFDHSSSDLQPDGIQGAGQLTPASTSTEDGVNYAQFNGLTSLTGGGLGYTVGNNSVILPIELVQFDARPVNDEMVVLDWVTASEINSDFFGLERSIDGITWEQFGKEKAAGNSNDYLVYSATDFDPFKGVSYYRLRLVDRDGTYEYSEVEEVRFDNQIDDLGFGLYPNPNQGSFIIQLGEVPANTSLVIRNSIGQIVQSWNVSTEADQSRVIQVNGLAAGAYLVQLSSGDNVKNAKLIVQ